LFSATKALFQLWNNLAFTVKNLSRNASSAGLDFIYQRYSRFNWTGVLLSIVTGLPLVLEYNGSEVWISKQWDPDGLLWLLKRFERLNLRAADLIFVVSDVERRNLIASGVSGSKIIVNPNGVDTDRFRPDCGGREVRRALGIEDRVVIGFVGTFGPWHGASVLAEAATRINEPSRCHFILSVLANSVRKLNPSSRRFPSVQRLPAASREMVPAYLDACDILVSPHARSVDGSEFSAHLQSCLNIWLWEKVSSRPAGPSRRSNY
jgi:glycosyltransferase involved in cell wall biosynthesis